MKISIIFDLDGTLWSSVNTCVEAWNQALVSNGFEPSITSPQIESIMGMKHDEVVEALLFFASKSEQEKISEEIFSAEIALINKQGGELFEHTKSVLSELAKTYPLFIVSNCQEYYIEAFLDYYDLWQFFKDFTASGITGNDKASNIKMIVEKHDLSLPVYIGDTEGDRLACEMADVPFIYANYGFGDLSNVKHTISNFTDLTKTNIIQKAVG